MATHSSVLAWRIPGMGLQSQGYHYILVGCHFLLQCMKLKSESEVAQSCPTLSDLMDCSLPGSSIHGIFQARVLEWGTIGFLISPYCSLELCIQMGISFLFYFAFRR